MAAVQEGSAQWQTTAPADASIIHYLYELTDAALRSNNDYVRAMRDQKIIGGYKDHHSRHELLMAEVLQTLITPPNQHVPALARRQPISRI